MSHSVFTDIVVFVNSVQSPILVSHNESIFDTLLVIEQWLKRNGGGSGISSKISKMKETLRTAGQDVVPYDEALVKQSIRADLLVSEKLKHLRNGGS